MSQSGTFSQGGGPFPPDVLETLTGDTGGAVPATANNINVLGGENINTAGDPGTSTLFINLNEVIRWPNTNSSGTTGAIYLNAPGAVGGTIFMHNFTSDPSDITCTYLGSNAGGALLGTGEANTGIGSEALMNIAGTFAFASGNTAVGASALTTLTDADSNTACGTASLLNLQTGFNNSAFGVDALLALTGGDDVSVSCFNTAVGAATAANLTGGAFNTIVGSGDGTNRPAGWNYTGTESSNILISNPGVLGENNTLRIGKQGTGNNQINRAFIAGIFGNTVNAGTGTAVFIDSTGLLGTIVSARKFKRDIERMSDEESADLMKLKPVSFNLKTDAPECKTKRIGLIAEEVEEYFPSLVVYDEDDKPFTVKYNDLPILLLNELQKQHTVINSLLRRINLLENTHGSYVDEL